MAIRCITTVIDAAASYDLITLTDLKTDLGITGTDDDAFLQRAIERTSQAVANYCGRVLPIEHVTDRFEFEVRDCRASLPLTHYPVTDVVSVTWGTQVLVLDVDYRIDMASGLLYRVCGDWGGVDVVVDYSGGYDQIPSDVQGAMTEMVRAVQFNRNRDPLLRSENILSGLYAYTLFAPGELPAGTPDQVAVTLAAYRAVRVQ